MIGQHIDQYQVLEKLGEGGMGTVYKARDHRLERLVALKVLSPQLAARPVDNDRLEQEAKAVSALNHPNIATIHDRGEYDGRPYLVFEYLSGGTLLEKLQACEGRLSLDQILDYATQAAQGLQHAHQRGVVHRDIKTENMMLTEDGRLKITDFGLAVRGAGRDTGEGSSAAGTAAYMSPEQGEGGDVDARSDLFSFGIVLFELATGRIPFEGPHPAAIAYDIIHTPTPPLETLRPDLPPELGELVQLATTKSREDRYQSIDALLADLHAIGEQYLTGAVPVFTYPPPVSRRSALWIAAAVALVLLLALAAGRFGVFSPRRAAPLAQPTSIAVLPLENLSNDPSQDYLAEGLTEALITDLAKLRPLRVTSRTAVLQYRGVQRGLPEIARELGVDRILVGTVLPVGDRIRITAQLIDGLSDEHVWAESFEYDASDVLALQREVSQAVASQVQAEAVSLGVLARPPRKVDPAAYAAYVRGRLAAFEWTLDGAQHALGEFEKALEIDPDYAEAHAGVAVAYGFMSFNGAAPASELWPKARAAAEKALEIDPTLDQAHTALGFVAAVYDWNWGGAEREFRRALELNPGSLDARHALAMTVLCPQGRLDEALEMMEEAHRIDPLSLAVAVNLADVHGFRGDLDEATAQYQRLLEAEPTLVEALMGIALAAFERGRPADALPYLERASALDESSDRPLQILVAAARGQTAEAREQLRQLESAAKASGGHAPWLLFAFAWSLIGDSAAALVALEEAYRNRDSHLSNLNVIPSFAPLRSDPRFQSILDRMNLGD